MRILWENGENPKRFAKSGIKGNTRNKKIMIKPTKRNVALLELPDLDRPDEVAGIKLIWDDREGIERPRACLGQIVSIGKEVEGLEIGQKVWYNRVDTFPFELKDKKYQIGLAKLLLAKHYDNKKS